MTDSFEDHCWKDVVSPEILEVYSCYQRETFVGPNPALLAIDLYEVVYRGGALPPKQLFAAARTAGLPVFYSTGDTREASKPKFVSATKRNRPVFDPTDYDIRPEFKPQPGDVVITKQRASAFYGTPLLAHLTQLGVQTLVVCGESTSGCVRASVVDAYSSGFHVVLVEECCFDRSELSHKVNLFDMHHKYADVMHLDEVLAHLQKLTKPAVRKAG
jgi:nicotinamidase-related amidase